MHGYKGFINDVKEVFGWLIENYSAEVVGKVDSDFSKYAVEIKLNHCTVLFDLDRMDLQGKFINPINKQQYHVSSVFELLKGECVLYPYNKGKESQIRSLLAEYSRSIQANLQEVLKGDFSWHHAYKERENQEKNLMAKVWKLPYGSPIKQKFWSGDSSWKKDILKTDS